MNLISRVLLGLAAVFVVGAALAQGKFPDRPLTIVVPFTPGSGTDTAARYYAEPLSKLLGQPVIVENRPGANGKVGVMAVLSKPADGYTLFMASNSPITVNPLITKDLGYDPFKDLRPISGLSRGMSVYLVPKQSKYQTLNELLEDSKRSGRAINMATYSAGQILANAWLAELSGAKIQNVSYKGQAPIMTDLVAGRLDAALLDISGSIPFMKEGTVRALAVTSQKRHFQFPDLTTVGECCFREFVYDTWLSVYVAGATSDPLVKRLEEAMQQILDTDYARSYQSKYGGGALTPLTAVQQGDYQRSQYETLKGIATRAGIVPK